MSIASVRTALATALRTISDLKVSEYITDELTPPHAMFDYAIEPHMVFARGADVYRFNVKVFANRSSDTASQKYLDLLRDPSTAGGLIQTIEEDATLDAAVDYARVTSVGEIQIANVGGAEYLMIEAQVEVVL